MSSFRDIDYAVRNRVAVITLNRPQVMNAWTATMEQSIREAVVLAIADDQVRVIVVTGAAGAFCAGLDMDFFDDLAPLAWNPQTLLETMTDTETATFNGGLGPSLGSCFGGPFGYLMCSRKPIIAVINGPVAGIGLVFALHADIRLAGEGARFCTAFGKRGLIAEHGIAWLLPRLVGSGHALDLLLSCRKIDAAEARRIGLVNQVFPDETLLTEVMDYAQGLITTVSPRSMAVMKAQVWSSLLQDYNQALAVTAVEIGKSLVSADFREGIQHFVKKRPPRFSGN